MNVWQFVASLVASLVWPAVIVVLVLIFRSSVADLISRIKQFEAGPQGVKLGTDARVEEAAAAAAKSTLDLDTVVAPLERVARAVGEGYETRGAGQVPSGLDGPPAGRASVIAQAVRQELESQVEQDEARRREEIERLITMSVQQGWSLAKAGFLGLPYPRIEWDADGRPRIMYSSTAKPE